MNGTIPSRCGVVPAVAPVPGVRQDGDVADGSGTSPGWLLDELRHAGVENLDTAHVDRYDEKEDSGAPAEVALCKSLGLDSTSTVVDIGAGTGQFTLAVAPWCRRVAAVDVSPIMCAALTTKLARTDLHNVEVIPAGFLSYEHLGGRADFVYSRYALHHLPDFWKGVALGRIHRFLRPGGIFWLSDVVYSFPVAEAHGRIEAWCATGMSDPDVGWARSELEDHVRDEQSTYSWLLEPMIEHAGFAIVDAHYSDDRFLAQYVLQSPSRP